MKAVVAGEFGGPEQLRVAQVADPVPGHGQIRVAVHAAGVNPVDAGNRAGGSWAGLHVPCILGYDIAGVADSAGPGVTQFGPGDRVMAMTRFPGGAGGYAGLAVVDAGLAAPVGPATSMTQAAAAPLAAGPAATIPGRLALRAGSRLPVPGASGGAGLFLPQLAAQRGIEVTAAGRQAMHQQMRALGAANCADYTSENLTRRTLELTGGPVDAVADLIGGRALAGATGALRTGGQAAATATPELDLDPLLDANITFHRIPSQDDGHRTREIAALLASGTLHPVISHQLPLAQAARAHRIPQRQHPGGKIVLTLPH